MCQMCQLEGRTFVIIQKLFNIHNIQTDYQGRSQEFWRAGEVFQKEGTIIIMFKTHGILFPVTLFRTV